MLAMTEGAESAPPNKFEGGTRDGGVVIELNRRLWQVLFLAG